MCPSLCFAPGRRARLSSRAQPKRTASEHRLAWAGTVLPGVALMAIFFLACLLLTGGGLDDSFITYRYAKHFAGGYGIAWNVGVLSRASR